MRYTTKKLHYTAPRQKIRANSLGALGAANSTDSDAVTNVRFFCSYDLDDGCGAAKLALGFLRFLFEILSFGLKVLVTIL